MKRKISTISNNSFDSIYSEKKLRLLKIIVPPLLKFPDIFSSSLRREVGGAMEWKVRKRLLRVRGEDFQRRLHHSCLSIERTKESQQRVPLSLLFNYSPYSVSPFFLSYSCTPFCHMNRPQFELERKVEILLERIRSGKMKYHRVLKKFFNL